MLGYYVTRLLRYLVMTPLLGKAVGTRTARECLKHSVDKRRKLTTGESLPIEDQVTMVSTVNF